MGDSKERFGTGATRSADVGNRRYDLIPVEATMREAERWGIGDISHGANNWKQGMPGSVIIQHLEEHLARFKEKLDRLRAEWDRFCATHKDGDTFAFDWGDDDVAAMRWGCSALMWYQSHDIHALTAVHTKRPAPTAVLPHTWSWTWFASMWGGFIGMNHCRICGQPISEEARRDQIMVGPGPAHVDCWRNNGGWKVQK